jgi:hypothetical protein
MAWLCTNIAGRQINSKALPGSRDSIGNRMSYSLDLVVRRQQAITETKNRLVTFRFNLLLLIMDKESVICRTEADDR